MCPRRKSLKDIAKEMAKLRHNDCIAYVTQSFGDRQNILWRSLDDLMAVATQSFDDRQKIYGIEFSVFNREESLVERLRMWMDVDVPRHQS